MMNGKIEILCGKSALTLAHWPGHDPLPVCADHHGWIVRVAGALGLYISTTQAEPGATCNQILQKETVEEIGD